MKMISWKLPNVNPMKRKGHPLRKKVLQGELVLVNPLDISDREIKLSVLDDVEREMVVDFLESYQERKKHVTV